ncbi:MAG: oligosaccharide flippase family protein [Patescibacteria group bacterium]
MASNSSAPSFTKILVAGETLLGFWNATSKVLGLINSFFIIYSLSLFQYGLYQLILAFIGLVSVGLFDGINGVVLNDIIRRENEEKQETAKALFRDFVKIKLALGLLLSTGVFLSANFIASIYDKDIGTFIRIVSIIFIFDAIISSFDVFLRVKLRLRSIAIQSFIREVAKTITLGFFLSIGTVLIREVLIAHVISIFTLVIFLFIVSHRDFFYYLKSKTNSGLLGILNEYGKWAILKEYSKRFGSGLRPWFIKVFISTEAVALFSVAMSIISFLQSYFPGNFLTSLVPRELSDPVRLRRIFVRGLKYLNLIGLFFAVVGMLLVPIAITYFLPKYTSALPYFILLTLMLPLYGISKMTGSMLVAYREQRSIFFRTIFFVILLLGLSPILFTTLGLYGVVLVVLIDYLTSTLYFLIRVWKIKPALRFQMSELFIFDAYDRNFIGNVIREFFITIKRWFFKV